MNGEGVFYTDDPLAVYLNEAKKVPALSRDEEIDCVNQVRGGGPAAEAAATRLVYANLLLVVSIAERYREGRLNMLDFIEHGNIGLMRAVKNVGDGCDRFSDHAIGYIERAIEEAIAGAQ